MRYVQTSSGSFARHIRDEFESIRWDETNKTSVRKLPDDKRVEFGISRLQMVTPPAFDSASQTRGEGDAVLVGDVWTQSWVVTDLAGDDLDSAQEEAANTIRSSRDSLLAATDWQALSDITMTDEMTSYRQALRDVPAQAGFPNTIDWPTSP